MAGTRDVGDGLTRAVVVESLARLVFRLLSETASAEESDPSESLSTSEAVSSDDDVPEAEGRGDDL